ncbi:hypothetical protein M0802_010407 [Mischocyttarus mexicanus]|nr:hypothetical protein M0802_010407 [Mischocyttarus mexicanus]
MKIRVCGGGGGGRGSGGKEEDREIGRSIVEFFASGGSCGGSCGGRALMKRAAQGSSIKDRHPIIILLCNSWQGVTFTGDPKRSLAFKVFRYTS